MFYGWYIVLAGLVFTIFHGAIGLYGFSTFIDPIALTFGWSYTQISLATSIRGFEGGALNPILGVFVDRYSAKSLAIVGVFFYSVGLFLLSLTNSLWMFYACFVIFGLGASLSYGLLPQTTMVRWFRKNLGKAIGIMFVGYGLGGAFVPLLIYLIDRYGWRQAFVILSVATMVLCMPLSFVFRTRPEDHGLLPDGGLVPTDRPSPDVSPDQRDYLVKDALKTRAFWHFSITALFQMCAASALVTHSIPYLTSIGLGRSAGGFVATAIPLTTVLARLPFGWLSDTFERRWVNAIPVTLTSLGLFLSWMLNQESHMLIFMVIILVGIGIGGFMPSYIPLFREYYGSAHFAKIYGLANIFFLMGMVAGPPLAGFIYDTHHTFTPAWLLFSGTGLLGVISVLTAPAPAKYRQPNPSPTH